MLGFLEGGVFCLGRVMWLLIWINLRIYFIGGVGVWKVFYFILIIYIYWFFIICRVFEGVLLGSIGYYGIVYFLVRYGVVVERV